MNRSRKTRTLVCPLHLALVLLLVMAHLACAQSSKPATTALPLAQSGHVMELSPNTQYDVDIRDSEGRFVWGGDGNFLYYASFKTFHFIPPSDGRYLVRYQSDNSFLNLRAFTS